MPGPYSFSGTRVTLVNDDGSLATSPDASIASGAARLPNSAATTNPGTAKNSPGRVLKVMGLNTVANARYVKLYNKASNPVVGTDVPLLTLAVPASAAFAFDVPAFLFSTGIAYAITGAAADADTTAIGAGDITGLNILYS